MTWLIAALAAAAAAVASADGAQPQLPATPAAAELFDRDWALMNWALKLYDSNGDILLQPNEAAAAGEAFRKLADTDRDGRVTQEEYRAARAFILSRY
jgi:hypothetical protein